MSELVNEYGKAAAMPASSPVFNLQILSCDYDRGWTWYLQIGRRNFIGWQPVLGKKPQSSPEKAYEDFMKWASVAGVEKLSEAIASEQEALKSLVN